MGEKNPRASERHGTTDKCGIQTYWVSDTGKAGSVIDQSNGAARGLLPFKNPDLAVCAHLIGCHTMLLPSYWLRSYRRVGAGLRERGARYLPHSRRCHFELRGNRFLTHHIAASTRRRSCRGRKGWKNPDMLIRSISSICFYSFVFSL